MTTTEQPIDMTPPPSPPAPPPDPLAWRTPDGQDGYAWNDLLAMSEKLSRSSLVPPAYRARPENIVMIAIIGQELGWGIATAMRFVQVIDGKPTVSPEGMLALVRRAGHSVTGESTSVSATVRGRRRDNGEEMECTFSVEDARRAKLAHKDNWLHYPAAMCWARALSMLCRRLFSDVMLGAAYVPEEMGASVDERGDVIETTATVDPEPDYHSLGWRDDAHLDAARRATKVLLDQLSDEYRVAVRSKSGKAPPLWQYTYEVWLTRHEIVRAAAKELGLADGFIEDLDPALARYDPNEGRDPEPAEPDAIDADAIDVDAGEMDAATPDPPSANLATYDPKRFIEVVLASEPQPALESEMDEIADDDDPDEFADDDQGERD